MKAIRELIAALLFMAEVGLRQLFAPVKGITYTGSHRQQRGVLSTMQESEVHRRAQEAGAAGLASAAETREILAAVVLPKRIPGQTAADLEAAWWPALAVQIGAVAAEIVLPLRSARPGYVDVTDAMFAEMT
jgi:hypothetical protein